MHQLKQLTQIATILMGQSPSSSSCSEDGPGLPFIQGNAEFGTRCPTPRLRCSVPTRICEKGDFLLSVRAPVGELNQSKQKMVIGRGLSAIRFSYSDQPFSWHSLKSAVHKLDRVAQGSTFVAVSRHDVECLEIPWFSEECYRQNVACVLDTIDEAIAKSEAVIAKLKQVRTGMLHDLLSYGLDEHGQLRDPIAHPEQFKDSPLGRIPREWKIEHLLNRITLPEGQVDPRISPYSEWILIAPDHIESATGRLIARKTAKEQGAISGKYVFGPGDIVYSKIRPYLRKAVLATESGLCSADMYPLRPNDNVDSTFLLATVLNEPFSRFASAVSMRSGFPKINRKELAEFIMPWPSIDEQRLVSEKLNTFDAQRNMEDLQLSKLKQLKSGFQDDLLTGRVRVPETIMEGAAEA